MHCYRQQRQNEEWYFNLKEFNTVVGFEFRFFGGPREKEYLHIFKITEVVPLKKLSHGTMVIEGNSLGNVRTLRRRQVHTKKLTHEGLETFPADNPDFAKENFAGGWTEIFGRSLKEFVEK